MNQQLITAAHTTAAHTGDSVILPGSVAQRTGDKLTCDKANLMNAPKNYNGVTGVLHQRLCHGVRPGVSWAQWSVRHMAVLAQSCKRGFCRD